MNGWQLRGTSIKINRYIVIDDGNGFALELYAAIFPTIADLNPALLCANLKWGSGIKKIQVERFYFRNQVISNDQPLFWRPPARQKFMVGGEHQRNCVQAPYFKFWDRKFNCLQSVA